jgi:hypothetical protein
MSTTRCLSPHRRRVCPTNTPTVLLLAEPNAGQVEHNKMVVCEYCKDRSPQLPTLQGGAGNDPRKEIFIVGGVTSNQPVALCCFQSNNRCSSSDLTPSHPPAVSLRLRNNFPRRPTPSQLRPAPSCLKLERFPPPACPEHHRP